MSVVTFVEVGATTGDWQRALDTAGANFMYNLNRIWQGAQDLWNSIFKSASNEEDAGPEENTESEGDSDAAEKEYKTKKKVKGKQKDDIPNRFKSEKPYKGESGKDAAKRVLEEYGEYDPKDTGPGSDFNKLKKYFDTHFE